MSSHIPDSPLPDTTKSLREVGGGRCKGIRNRQCGGDWCPFLLCKEMALWAGGVGQSGYVRYYGG